MKLSSKIKENSNRELPTWEHHTGVGQLPLHTHARALRLGAQDDPKPLKARPPSLLCFDILSLASYTSKYMGGAHIIAMGHKAGTLWHNRQIR